MANAIDRVLATSILCHVTKEAVKSIPVLELDPFETGSMDKDVERRLDNMVVNGVRNHANQLKGNK